MTRVENLEKVMSGVWPCLPGEVKNCFPLILESAGAEGFEPMRDGEFTLGRSLDELVADAQRSGLHEKPETLLIHAPLCRLTV
jgi:hypothetical protein